MAKRFKETREELQVPALLCQDACPIFHPYITASRTNS